MNRDEFAAKDTALRHAMQTGIKMEQAVGNDQAFYSNNPVLSDIIKHLRVGLNCAMVEHATITQLLVKKGVVTEEEYFDQAIKDLQGEVKRAEQRLSDYYGRIIHLG